jgi:pilus assembly protein Flp/PilA
MRFLREEDGPTTVEYAVILSLILAVCIASIGQLATAVGNSFNASASEINSAIGN